jgi:hypothetical protein
MGGADRQADRQDRQDDRASGDGENERERTLAGRRSALSGVAVLVVRALVHRFDWLGPTLCILEAIAHPRRLHGNDVGSRLSKVPGPASWFDAVHGTCP